ncbi:serpin-Z10-like [Coffea eugenioides]|uniref:serpin-Z10-like n=1 Tax=Coffea eugenioides TaxID=49369 RepID=UPI000F613E4B|nr:serpin-Z10-like [Coffea eugenioides]
MDFCTQMSGLHLLNKIKQEIEKGFDKGFKENLVVSPLSFSAILNMIAAGSTGLTFSQMTKFLGCKSYDDINSKFLELMSIASPTDDAKHSNGGPVICLVNGLWVDKQYPLKASYQELVESVYKVQAKTVDLRNEVDRVVEEANEWAKSATKGLVTDVLQPCNVTPDTKLILGNALYFKGCWEEKFNAKSTKNLDFYLLNGDKISAPFMTGCNTYTQGSYDGFEVVKIPYQRGKQDRKAFSFFIFLPNEIDGLQKLLETATSDPGFFSQHFQLIHRTYDIFRIPKFKFAYRTAEGPQTMKDMGLCLPFMEDCRELTGLVDTKNEPFFVSEIVQKAFIEVDEVGTEAAAVSIFDMACGCSRYYEPTRFVADHPFMFMIREEESRSVLFTGAVLNPLLK